MFSKKIMYELALGLSKLIVDAPATVVHAQASVVHSAKQLQPQHISHLIH